MVNQMALLQNALAYARFSDEDISNKVTRLVETVGTDLEEAGYEPSTATELAESELQDAMNEADEVRAKQKAEDDEFEEDEDVEL